MKTAVVFGASGLVGGYLVEELLVDAEYSKIKVFQRQESDLSNEKLELIKVDFTKLEEHSAQITGDEIYILLGTTIKKAGSIEKMEQIDRDLPIKIATIAKNNGVPAIAVVSSVGANVNSKGYYLRIKGEMEQGILALNYGKTILARPSILLGKRNEWRFGETIGKIITPAIGVFLFGKLKKYRAIHGRVVAMAIKKAIASNAEKIIYESDDLQRLKS